MDRIGFELIDAQYQKELAAEKQRINEKWTIHFAGKKYSGTEEMIEKAKTVDERQRDQKIREEMTFVQKRIHDVHFVETPRAEMLSNIEEKEKVADYIRKTREGFNRKAGNDRTV